MQTTIKPWVFISSILAALFLTALVFATQVHANPSGFVTLAGSATATTTRTFVTTTQNATSSALDTYTNYGSAYAFGSNQLLVQYEASSTSAVLGIRYQYSQDGIDWYDDNYYNQATTTQTVDISQYTSYKWTPVSVATTSKLISVPTPTRYTRVIFTETGANGAVWYTWVPKREDK